MLERYHNRYGRGNSCQHLKEPSLDVPVEHRHLLESRLMNTKHFGENMFRKQNKWVVSVGSAILVGFVAHARDHKHRLLQSQDRVSVSLTGKLASFGKSFGGRVRNNGGFHKQSGGVKGLGGAKVVLVQWTLASDPTSAGSPLQRLLSREKVSAVIGCFG